MTISPVQDNKKLSDTAPDTCVKQSDFSQKSHLTFLKYHTDKHLHIQKIWQFRARLPAGLTAPCSLRSLGNARIRPLREPALRSVGLSVLHGRIL